jgi:hypothetical protein
MEEDIATDDRLVVWWAQHQALLANETPVSHGKPSVPVHQMQEEQSETEETSSSIVGWVCREAAHAWGEQLLEALIAGGYDAEVRVHLEDRWYQLVLVGEGCEYVLVTPQQVPFVVEQVSSEEAVRENS